MEKFAVERSIWIAAKRERVWSAITEAEQLSQWFAPGSRWEIPVLKVGATVKFYNTETDIAVHRIEVLDPPHQFVLSWEEQNKPMLTTFTLKEENDGTRVTILEEGFESLPANIRQKRLDETAKGYAISLENLKAYVERSNN